jgi:hypothetical protein
VAGDCVTVEEVAVAEVVEEDEEARDEVVEEGVLKELVEAAEESVVAVVIVSVDNWIVVGGRTTMVTSSKPEKASKMEWRLIDNSGSQEQNDLAPPPPRVDCGDGESGFLERCISPILSRICCIAKGACVCVFIYSHSPPPPCDCRSTLQPHFLGGG